MYVRLAISKEHDTEEAFGQDWRDYASETPRFVPRLSRGDRARPVCSH
jgi:protein-S-isoprenylcysteine O-methyltransferase Ste14